MNYQLQLTEPAATTLAAFMTNFKQPDEVLIIVDHQGGCTGQSLIPGVYIALTVAPSGDGSLSVSIKQAEQARKHLNP